MGAPDPEQAVIAAVAAPAGRWEGGEVGAGGWQSGFVRGGNPFQADASSIRLVKHRASAQRHLYWVTFTGVMPHRRGENRAFSWVYPVEPDVAGGWRVGGGAGGADEPAVRSFRRG